MPTIRNVCTFLEEFAPLNLAEEWDNVGLLVGDDARPAGHIMTCLTITPRSAKEAIERGADLIVTHHPLPFRPVKRLTSQSTQGRLLLDLIAAHVAIYSPHTAFDSAAAGINQHLAEGIGLCDIRPLVPADLADTSKLGSGRCGALEAQRSVDQFVDDVKQLLSIDHVRVVTDSGNAIERVAVTCGSGGTFLDAARRAGCDCLVTGETNFHTCLEAEAVGMTLVLTGHFASERFAVETLAKLLGEQFPDALAWASDDEADPLRLL